MKLKWFGSGTGAGMYLDLYEVEGGREIVVGAHRECDKPSREEVISAFAGLSRAPQWEVMDRAPKDGTWIWGYTPEDVDVGCPNSQPVRWLDESPVKHNGVTVRPAGWYGDGFDRDRPVDPKRWMPMPPLSDGERPK